MAKFKRRDLVFLAASLLPIAVCSAGVRADNEPPKPEIKRSEAKPLIKKYVDELSDIKKRYTGVELSLFEKNRMEHEILEKMEASGAYNFWDP